MRDSLAGGHFGRFIAAYRAAHTPPLTQANVGRWLGMTQAQVSRMERVLAAPSELRKLQHWAAVLGVPVDMLWFAPNKLLRSMSPTENKVRALVLADLATSAARGRDYDRVRSLSRPSAALAIRTECSLAIDRLWDLAEALPATGPGAGRQLKDQLVEQLMTSAGRA